MSHEDSTNKQDSRVSYFVVGTRHQELPEHLDHTVTWGLVQIHMCFVLFISSNELCFAKAYYHKVFTYVPLNSKVFELRKTCSTKLFMSILGCGYFAHCVARTRHQELPENTSLLITSAFLTWHKSVIVLAP